jgi:hypothetical protein
VNEHPRPPAIEDWPKGFTPYKGGWSYEEITETIVDPKPSHPRRLPLLSTQGQFLMKRSAIAAVIAHDLLRADDVPSTNVTRCFSCGHGMIYRGNRFCSESCRDWFDDCNPPYASLRIIYRDRASNEMRIGATGFRIPCAHCGREFDSRGLRCCSTNCERAYRERQDNLAIMAEVGIEPATKRRCTNCGGTIPRWRNGRQVRQDARFCSPKCGSGARQPTAIFQGDNVQKVSDLRALKQPL